MTTSYKEPPRPNPTSALRRSLEEVTEAVKAQEEARLAEHSERTARLREARLARDTR